MKSPAPARFVKYGKDRIHFTIGYSNRRTLGISVDPDLSVIVTAPIGTPITLIKDKVRKKASWIIKQQTFFSQFLPQQPPRRYVSGETLLYLGKQYRLKIETGDDESVKLKNGWIHVRAKRKTDVERIKALLDKWLADRAREHFQASLDRCFLKFRRRLGEPPQMKIRKMSKRWGTCTHDGVIHLNPELIKAPSYCIDYVVTHELCHLVFPNHGKDFYSLLRRAMPDWEDRKTKLERVS